MRCSAVLLACWSAFACVAHGEEPAENRLAEELHAYCRDWSERGFSGAVLVRSDGNFVLHRGYGDADREAGRANTPETLFEIASLSKQFTAAAILALEQDDKLSTDDLIGEHLPKVPQAYQSVTLYHLLTHTGGLPAGGSGHGLDLERAVGQHLSVPPSTAPGKTYSYSNVGYALLAGVVEQASGQPFEAYCRERLFQRAGLRQTGFCGEAFPGQELALGYSRKTGEPRTPNQDPYPPKEAFGYEYRGMGGVVTSTSDLDRWMTALAGDSVLSAESKRKFFQPYRSNYACGWEAFTFSEGQRCLGHGGSVRGYICKLWSFPDDDCLIVVLSNNDAFDYRMLSGLKARLFDETAAQRTEKTEPPIAAPLSDAVLDRLAGSYPCSQLPGLKLRLKPQEETVAAALIPAFPESAEVVPSVSSKTAAAVIEAIAAGDTGPLAAHMHESIPKSWPKRMTRHIWPKHEAVWGKLAGVQELGSFSVNRDDEQWTYVWLRLRHEKGDCVSFVGFRPGGKLQLLVMDANESLFGESGRLTPDSENQFVRESRGKSVHLNVETKGRVFLESRLVRLAFLPRSE